MDLFEYMREQTKEQESPLASRLRPTTLEEVVGQEHIIGKGKLLYRAIKADKLSSIIFYGPRYREDNTCQGDRQYDECRIFADQCNIRWQKRYGTSCKTGTG